MHADGAPGSSARFIETHTARGLDARGVPHETCSPGALGAAASHRHPGRRSPGSSSVATWRCSPPAAWPLPPSPARSLRCAATSVGRCDRASSASTRPPACRHRPGPRGCPVCCAPTSSHQILDEPAPDAGVDRSRGHRPRRRRARAAVRLRAPRLGAVRARLDQVDLARRRLTVWGKGAKERVVPLSEPSAVRAGRMARRRSCRAPRQVAAVPGDAVGAVPQRGRQAA